MRILFLSDNFPPEVNAPATRTYEHCLEWVKKGAAVTVITCFPNFPHGRLYPGYRNRFLQIENMDGIRVIRVWTYMAPNRGFVRRLIDYVSFAMTSFWVGLFRKTDLIVATSPQLFSTVSGYMLSVFKRKPWVFELRDLWPSSIKCLGAVTHPRLLAMIEKLELFLYKKATLIVPNTNAFKRNLVQRGIDGGKIKVVTNGSNLDHYFPKGKNNDLVIKYGLANKFVVGYIGTVGMAHGLDFIVKAARKTDEASTVFLIIGDGANRESVRVLSKNLGLTNVLFLDPIAKEKVPEYLSVVDVALIPLRKAETFKTVIPSKIFEAAAMQKPILLGVEGEAKQLVSMYEAGLCYEPENEKDFLDKLRRLREDHALYERFKRGCSKLAIDFDRKKLARKMYGILQEAAGFGVREPVTTTEVTPLPVSPQPTRVTKEKQLAGVPASEANVKQ